jgi:hypothetical protein
VVDIAELDAGGLRGGEGCGESEGQQCGADDERTKHRFLRGKGYPNGAEDEVVPANRRSLNAQDEEAVLLWSR